MAERLESLNHDVGVYFLSHSWCCQWWEHVGARDLSHRLQVFILRDAGSVVAILPLMSVRCFAGVRKLVQLGSAQSEYAAVLIDPVETNDHLIRDFVLTAIKHVAADVVVLKNIPQCSVLAAALGVRCGEGGAEASMFDLTEFESSEAYRLSLSRSTRRSRNKRRNKLARLGELSYKVYFADQAEYRNLVLIALRMKRQWAEAFGRTGRKLNMPGLEQFLTALEGSSEQHQGALAGALLLDDVPVAVEVGFLHNGHYYSYIGAYDMEMGEYSVGKVQLEDALKWAIDTGVKKYDLLAEPAAYKGAWSNTTLPLGDIMMALSAKGHAVVAWERWGRPNIKRLFNGLSTSMRMRLLRLLPS